MAKRYSWEDQARRLRADGLSYAKIAERLGAGYGTVYRVLNPSQREWDRAYWRRRYANEEFRRAYNEHKREYQNRRRQDPRIREHERAKHRAYIRWKWANDSEWRNKCKEANRAYFQTPRGKIVHRLADERRREREAQAGGKGLTVEQFEALWEQQHGRCFYCNKPMKVVGGFNAPDQVTLDHILPLSRGGRHELNNIVLCCRHCNTSKGAKTPQEAFGLLPLAKDSRSLLCTHV